MIFLTIIGIALYFILPIIALLLALDKFDYDRSIDPLLASAILAFVELALFAQIMYQ